DHRSVVRNTAKDRGPAGNGVENTSLHFHRAIQVNVDHVLGPDDFPRIAAAKPTIGLLDLIAVLDLLMKKAVFIAQTITDSRDSKSGHRLDETSRQPAQAPIAQSRIRLFQTKLSPVLSHIRSQVLANELLDTQIHNVVGQGAPNQELQRQI